jgi:hypothetical protein
MRKYQRSPEGEANRLAAIPKGKNHWRYSDNPTVSAIHRWINKWYGRAYRCESPTHDNDIVVKKYDWALLKDKDYSKDINHFWQLCRKCHIKYDGITEKVAMQLRGRVGKMKGYKHSLKSRMNMSLAHLGKPSPKKGKHYTF